MNTYPSAAGRTTSRPVMPRTVAATVSVTSRGPVSEEATAANESTFSSALSRALVRPAQAAVIAEAAARPMVHTAPNWAVPTRTLARDWPSLFHATAPSCSSTIKAATEAPMPNVNGRIACSGPVADRSGSLKASMTRNATASAHMAADHNATMAPFHPSAVATAAASPSQLIGLNLPRSMPKEGTALISVRPCRVWPCRLRPCSVRQGRLTAPAAGLLTAELLVPGVDGRVGAGPDGRRRRRLSAGPDHPAVAGPGHPLAVGHGHPRGPCQGGVDLEVHAGHHPVASVGGLDQPHERCGNQGKVRRLVSGKLSSAQEVRHGQHPRPGRRGRPAGGRPVVDDGAGPANAAGVQRCGVDRGELS